jgi:hypothetical protein
MEINKSQQKKKGASGPEWPSSAWSSGDASLGAKVRAWPSSEGGSANCKKAPTLNINQPALQKKYYSSKSSPLQ